MTPTPQEKEIKRTVFEHGGSRIWAEDEKGVRTLIADTYGQPWTDVIFKAVTSGPVESEAKVTEADREAAEELAMKVCEMTDWKDTVQYVASALAQRHADGIREGVEKGRREIVDVEIQHVLEGTRSKWHNDQDSEEEYEKLRGALEDAGKLIDRLREERRQLLSVKTKEGLLASEWIMRTEKAEDHSRELEADVKGMTSNLNRALDKIIGLESSLKLADARLKEVTEENLSFRRGEFKGYQSIIDGLKAEIARLRELTRPVEDVVKEINEATADLSFEIDVTGKPHLKGLDQMCENILALCQRVRASAERKALEVLPFSKEEGLIVQKVFEAVKDSAVADGLLEPGYNKKLDELPPSVEKQSQVAVWAVLEFLRTRSTGKGEV